MRKLTKKISMLMVLAMLVGLFSGVVSASAASAWSFKSGKYNVAVGGEINMKKNEYADFDLLKDGKAPEGYTVVWESSDEDVVWVNAKTGQLRADKAKKAEDGDKAVISATFTNTKTKKSATRSFTIVVGEVKAPVYTVEQADVTAVLGDAIKFAPVVKNEAGEVVKFATHKSYNGYFLDGKAITNPWTPEAAGEYTVVVAQFASKADVADLAKAVRKDEVKVTVKADLAAEATGVKEITVYGDFAKDAKFAVKKGAQNVSFTVAVAEDGKSAKLALANKLTNGTYTVTYGGASVEIVAEDEKATTIVILEKGGQILTDSTKTKAYVHYDVLNQYGESVRKAFDPSWSCTATVDKVDRNNGIITLEKTGKFDYNDMVVLTGVVTGYGFAASETANMTIGLEQNIDTVKVLGIVKGESTDVIEEIPASYIGGPYYLVFATYDNAGNLIDFDADDAAADLKFISMNPLLAKFENEVTVDTLYIDGVAYGKVKLEKPSVDNQLKKGGVAEISITSTKTGNSTPYSVRIVSEQILDSFKIFAPDTLLVNNNAKDEDNTFYFGFEALDTEGNKITDFRALYKAVQFSDSNVTLAENNDGTASLSFKTTAVESNDGFDSIAVFNATVLTSGKSEQVRLNIKPDRYAASVANLASKNGASEYVVEGNSIDIGLVTDSKNLWVEFNDQYDEKLANKTDNLFRKGQYIAVKPVEAGVLSVVTGGAGYIDTLDDGTVLFDMLVKGPKADKPEEDEYKRNAITLTAAQDIQVSKKAAVVEFAIYEYVQVDGEWVYKLVGGSDKKFTFYVVDIDQCVEFSLGCGRWWTNLWQYGVNKEWYGVSATLANGKKVDLTNITDNYYIMYNTADNANGAIFEVQASASSGAGIQVNPTLTAEAVAAATSGTSVFFDYSKPLADAGKYADRNHKLNVNAVIYDADDNVIGSASTAIEVSARYPYGVSLTFNEDWNRHWTVSLSGDKTTGTVRADHGVITKAQLNSVFKGVTTYYTDNDSTAVIDLTITKLVEAENGLNPNGDAAVFALGTGDDALVNAEIGDTFVATYSNGGLSHTIKFTVGADLDAKVCGSNFETGTWR